MTALPNSLTEAPDEDVGVNTSAAPRFADVATRMLSRRAALRGMLSGAALASVGGRAALAQSTSVASGSTLTFPEIAPGPKPDHAVAQGYKAQVLIRWGDPVLPSAPAFDVRAQTGASQAAQFGYNNDFLGYFPLPPGSGSSGHGLLYANHEYTEAHMMFPGLRTRRTRSIRSRGRSWTWNSRAMAAP